jgi:hypothetical protein
MIIRLVLVHSLDLYIPVHMYSIYIHIHIQYIVMHYIENQGGVGAWHVDNMMKWVHCRQTT